jgi:hypothetical protein
MLLYSCFDSKYLMRQKIKIVNKLLLKANEEDIRNKLYQLYIAHNVYMDKDNYISFEQFYNNQTNPVKKGNKEEVNNKVDTILKAMCDKK